MTDGNAKNPLSETVKASVTGSGALAHLGKVAYSGTNDAANANLHELKQQAQTTIETIQQLLDSGRLDDSTSLKLTWALDKLRTALGKGAIFPTALAAALSEATASISSAGGAGKGTTLPQTAAQLWQKVDADNKDIDDDFEKMRKAGIAFNDPLWNKHKQLMEYSRTNPHDLKRQKELDAVDDALLMQAEPQLKHCPDAQSSFDDAKKKSKDRHQVVDKDLAGVGKNTAINNSISMADFDDDAPASNGKLTMNDVSSQSIGHKSKPVGKQFT